MTKYWDKILAMFLYYSSLNHVSCTMLPGHGVYPGACTCTRVVLHMHTYTRQRVHRACRRDCKDRALLLALSLPPSSVSVARSGPVFMRVSMGKGSATRTRRKIISDLPRARRSCRPPYIAPRSVLRRIFEMETHPLVLTLRPAVAIALQQRSFDETRKEKKRKRERERERRVCSEIGCDRKS